MRFLKRVNDRGTLTLPAEVREALQVEAGDIVEFEVIGVVRRGGRNVEPVHAPVESFQLRGEA